MDSSEWQHIKAIFEQAVSLPEDARKQYLMEACKNKPTWLTEVKELLHFVDDTPFILDQPIQLPLLDIFSPNKASLPSQTQIDDYVLIDTLGQGGMGCVYLARRIKDAFVQQVAIKLIRTDRVSDELVARFERERRILANLNHPGIAMLIDGGITPEGAPYLVMEYIEGLPLLEYIERYKPDLPARLALFQQICDAVQAAHQGLIVHRDLKPSNILVTQTSDQKGQRIKLLDFGIAKLLEEEPAELLTQTHMFAMTPEYASPEQFSGKMITTASDIYALGVILYEILAGRRPFDLKGKKASEIEHIVCQITPKKPSTSASVSRDDVGLPYPAVSARALKGDLDNIILKALAKDPGRRYESVSQFSADLDAFLRTRPVLARPDTAGYRLSKFIARNKSGVLISMLVLLLLAGGFLSTRQQARLATNRFNQVRTLANSLLSDLHDAIRDLPGATHAREKLVSEALTYLSALNTEQHDDPSLLLELAAAYDKIGRIQGDPHYTNLGDLEGAHESYQAAHTIRESLWKQDSLDAVYRHALGVSYGRLGVVNSWKGNREKSISQSTQALSLLLPLLSNTPSDTLRYDAGRIQSELGWYYIWEGDIKEGLELLDEAIPLLENIPSYAPIALDVELDLWRAYYYKIDGLRFSTRHTEALMLLENRALPLLKNLYARFPTNARVQYAYHTCLWFIGAQNESLDRLDIAKDAFTQSLLIAKNMVAADSANQKGYEAEAFANVSLATLHHAREAYDQAGEYIDDAISIRSRLYHANPENTNIKGAVASAHRMKCRMELEAKRFKDALSTCEFTSSYYESLLSENDNMINRGAKASTHYYLATANRALAMATSIQENRNSYMSSALSQYRNSYEILEIIQRSQPDLAWEVHPDSVLAEIQKTEQLLNY